MESSTTSAKVLICDTLDGSVSTATERFHTDGATARDPDEICRVLFALARRELGGRTIDLVVLAGTWHGLTLQSDAGDALSPVMEWPFAGARPVSRRMRGDAEFTDWFYGRTGCMVNAIYPAFKLRMLADAGVDLGAGIAMDQGMVLFHRLTGTLATSRAQASGTGLLNAHTGEWDDAVPDSLGIGGVRLPPLVDDATTAPLTAAGAAALGVRTGIPVLVAGPDGGLSQLGDDSTGDGQMTFSMGTSGALRLSSSTPVLSPTHATWCYRSPDSLLTGAATSGCGNIVDWARPTLLGRDTTFAQIETMLHDDARDLPVFLPFLFGERCPGWHDDRSGGFDGVRASHSAVDLYQAVLQGIVFNLLQGYRELTALAGTPDRIRLSGGVLSSPFWTQMVADVFGVGMEVSAQQHASTMGAIRLGMRALGADDSVLVAAPTGRIEPRPDRTDSYAEAFEDYLAAYRRSTPLDTRSTPA